MVTPVTQEDSKVKNFGLIKTDDNLVSIKPIIDRLASHGYKHTSDMYQDLKVLDKDVKSGAPKDLSKRLTIWPIDTMDNALKKAKENNLTTAQFKLSFENLLDNRSKEALNNWAFKDKKENFINTAVDIYRDELAKEKKSNSESNKDETASSESIKYNEPDKIYGEMKTSGGRVVKFNRKEFEDVKNDPIKAKAFIDKLNRL